MPVEIRELVIKTEIQRQPEAERSRLNTPQLQALKQQIIQECLRQLHQQIKHSPLER